MGTSSRIIHRVLCKAFPDGPPRSVRYLDLGAQQLYGDTPEDYWAFYEWAGGRRLIEQPFREYCHRLSERSRADWEATGDGGPRTSVADLLEPLGWDYQSIDTRSGTLAWDLNFAVAEPPFVGHFDIVANYGTTEHVFNQLTCFKLIHELTKRGGTMVHMLPMSGYLYHCLYKYDPKLFLLLQTANKYEMLHAGFGSIEGSDRIDHRHTSWANYPHMRDYPMPNFLVEFMFRKDHDRAFVLPYDTGGHDLAIRYDFAEPCSSVR